jgi:hypothetical protein
MPTVTGIGTIPTARPCSLPVVKGLFNDLDPQNREHAKADTIAPVVEMGQFDGSYAVDDTWPGISLADTPSALSRSSFESTDYEGIKIQFGEREFSCGRYKLGKVDLSDRRVAKLRLENGIEMESKVAQRMRNRYMMIRYLLTAGALDTVGNYNGGVGTSSPLSLATSTANDLIGLWDDVKDYWRQEGRYTEGDRVLVVASGNIRADLKKQDQIRDAFSGYTAGATGTSPDLSLKGYATDRALSSWFSEYMDGAELLFLDGFYEDATGAKIRPFGDAAATNGAISFVRVGAGFDRSFLKTPIPGSEDLLSLRRERVEAMPGQVLYGDAVFDLHVQDPIAGYLVTGAAT